MVAAKLTQQQRNFCHAYLELGVAADAYQVAYPSNRKRKSAYEAACKLLKQPQVLEYLASLQKQAADEVEENAKRAVDQLNAAYDKAMAKDQPGAAVQAVMGKAKIMGFITDKKDITIGMRPDEARSIIESFLGSRK